MTQEEKRIAIARATGAKWYVFDSGWTWLSFKDLAAKGGMWRLVDAPENPQKIQLANSIPDYFSDLNACAEFERTDENHIPHLNFNMPNYVRILADMVGAEVDDNPDTGDFFLILNATATQRAESIGRALGLWKEGE